MDADGYPTDDELQRVREWPYTDPAGWFAYIKRVGNYWSDAESWGWTEVDGVDYLDHPAHVYHVSTGGWSGNELTIEAMQENTMLWLLTWQSSRRGGHYEFTVPK